MKDHIHRAGIIQSVLVHEGSSRALNRNKNIDSFGLILFQVRSEDNGRGVMSGREGWSHRGRLQELAGAREGAWQLPHPQLDLRDKWDPQRLGSCQKSSWTTTPGNLPWEEAHSSPQKDMQIGLRAIKVGRSHDATKGKQRMGKDGPEQPGP